jgi:glucose-6-phosphate isomerase
MTRVRLDIANLIDANLPEGGLDPRRLNSEGDLQARFGTAHEVFERRAGQGDLGFLELPHDMAGAEAIQELADGFGQWFEDVVVLGIGGSSLGTILLRDALLGSDWNQRSDEARDFHPRLHVLDNPDPVTTAQLLDRIDLRRTLVIVVSKSGSTAETMALYLIFRQRLLDAVGPESLRGHLLFITDPEAGVLRRIADAEGIPTLPVPRNVGGRFSVLSPVGLLPAAICGVDIQALLRGAAEAESPCRGRDLEQNPAGMLATLLHAADTELGHPIQVLMPYTDRLRPLTFWFQQLWAESLGKRTPGGGHVGPTPLPAVGATDQHAQVQLFMEGPRDKVVVFVAADAPENPLDIPRLHDDEGALAYLGGHSLAELLDTERRATTEALRRTGRPSLTLHVGPVDAEGLGALILLLEAATVYAGGLYGVDPLDQPGVELGKQLTYGLMGRAGAEAVDLPQPAAEWRIPRASV